MIFNQSISRVRPGWRKTRAGDRVENWAQATTAPIRRVHVQPLTQDEDNDTTARDERITTWRVYTRPGRDADVQATDRIVYDGRTCQVIGDVARWPHPIRPGRVHHVEFTIQEVEG